MGRYDRHRARPPARTGGPRSAARARARARRHRSAWRSSRWRSLGRTEAAHADRARAGRRAQRAGARRADQRHGPRRHHPDPRPRARPARARRLTVLMVSHALNEVANYVSGSPSWSKGGSGSDRRRDHDRAALTEMYGIPVEVDSFDGHRIVLARHHARRAPIMFEAVLLFREALYGALIIARRLLGARRLRRAAPHRVRRRRAGAALLGRHRAGTVLAGAGLVRGPDSPNRSCSRWWWPCWAPCSFGLGTRRALVPPDATIGVTYAVAGGRRGPAHRQGGSAARRTTSSSGQHPRHHARGHARAARSRRSGAR